MQCFSDDREYSARNLKEMRRFADAYPDYSIVQVSLAQLQEGTIWQAALAKLEFHDGFIQMPFTNIPNILEQIFGCYRVCQIRNFVNF